MSNTGLERFKPFASVHLVKLSFPLIPLVWNISSSPSTALCVFPLWPWIFTLALEFLPEGWCMATCQVMSTYDGPTTPMGLRLLDAPGFLCISSDDSQGPRPHPVFYYQFRLLNVPEKYKLFVTKMGCGVCCDPCFSCREVFHNWPFKSEKLI